MKADGSTSHTPTGTGFGYRQMATLLDAKKITLPHLARPDPADDREGLAIVAAALVRGQGKTEGLHRRTIRTPGALRDADGRRLPLDRIGEVAGKRAEEAGEAGNYLRRALMSLVQGGPKDIRFDDEASKKKIRRWIDHFDTLIDSEFFDDPFWQEVAGTTENARLEWRRRLQTLAEGVFEVAATALPRTEVRRIRARVRARSFLDGQMHNWLKGAEYGE